MNKSNQSDELLVSSIDLIVKRIRHSYLKIPTSLHSVYYTQRDYTVCISTFFKPRAKKSPDFLIFLKRLLLTKYSLWEAIKMADKTI